jgi:hypothetical protein
MSPATIVTVVIGAFFLLGIAVGVVAVIAAAALRTSSERAKRKLADRAEFDDRTGWPNPGPSSTMWTDTPLAS